MSTTALVVLALAFGVAVGVLFALLFRAAADRGAAAMDLQVDALPDGARAVVAVLAGPAVVVDGSNTVLQATAEAEALGLVVGRGLGHPGLDRVVDEARSAHARRDVDLALRLGSAGPRTLEVTARAAPIDVARVLMLIDDRSEALRLEAVRRDFVANVSHELKTPIGAVSLLAEAIGSASDDPEAVRRFAGRLSAEAGRLGALVQEILQFSRVQSADPLGSPELVGLDDVLSTAVERVRVVADLRGVEVVLGKRRGLHALGDAAQLTTAVQNLVANAVQFSPPHGHVGVGLRSRDGVAEITVSDQGTGIEEADLGRVFERFYRSDQARSRQTGGSGLGLSIVKHIAENHGGTVKVWSRPGRGSTFTIRVPEVEAPVVPRPKRREKERA